LAERHGSVLGRLGPLRALGACLGLATALFGSSALAGENDLVALRTQTRGESPARDEVGDLEAIQLARHVDMLIREAAQDLELTIDLSRRAEHERERELSDEALLGLSSDSWLLASRLSRRRGGLSLELRLIPPHSRVLYQRIERVEPEELEMRVAVMMRDLVEAGRGRGAGRPARESVPVPSGEVADRARSPGRAVLAFNSALLGAYVGYSLQQASGSRDERLTYPLAALGAGIGLGGSILVAEEWDIGLGDAWFLSAGMWWPSAAGWLISDSLDVADEDRYAYGVVSAVSGLSLAGAVVGFGHVTQGGAALAHSGGAFGTLLGGLLELTVDGSTDRTPRRGMGIGAGAGVVLAGALTLHLRPTASRVLLVDLGASLGALTGAAAASPLLLVDEESGHPTRTRLWLASIMTGTVAGAAIGMWTTSKSSGHSSQDLWPSIGVVSMTEQGPIYGAGLGGVW
jgi:hypothetical protein